LQVPKEDKTHSDIIALCMDQIGEGIAATRSQAGVVPFALHVKFTCTEIQMAQIRQISKKKISRSPDFDDNFQ